jgi:hypothetical protein
MKKKSVLLFGREIFFTCRADGADPIFWNIFPLGAGEYAVIGIALGFIVNITANITNVLHVIQSPL